MGVLCVDWRTLEAKAAGPLYASERTRWASRLAWDTTDAWDEVEAGRRLGVVPGQIAVDDRGAIAGWIFSVLHRGMLQIGGIVASTEDATRALLTTTCSGPDARRARSVAFFGFPEAPGIDGALTECGLLAERYDYLTKPLDEDVPQAPVQGLLPWRATDLAATAALLSRAYPGDDFLRPFAPRGTDDEWREYVVQMVGARGCGTVVREGCLVSTGAQGIDGVVLVTTLGPTTAHIPQLAVDPATQGSGRGRALLAAACQVSRRYGCRQVTLLVSRRNHRARRLYDAAGFRPVAEFVAAAPAVGGA